MAKSQAAGSHRSRVACGGGPTRDIVRRWPGSNASWVIDGVGFRVRATLWSGGGGVKDQIGFSAHGLPNEVTGQIEIQEVAQFIGAPEEIRTPDPQIRSLVLVHRGVAQAPIIVN
jgi:hypothetical protein